MGYADDRRTQIPRPGHASPAALVTRKRWERPKTEKVRFDRHAEGDVLLVHPKATDSLYIDLFTAGRNVDHVELVAVGITAMPLGVWHNMITWGFRVDRGAVQEFVPSSGISGATPTDRDAGLRGVPFGSLQRPAELLVRLGPSQVFQFCVIDHDSVQLFPNVALHVHARIVGYEFHRAAI